MGEACPDKQELQERLIKNLDRNSGNDQAANSQEERRMEDVGKETTGY